MGRNVIETILGAVVLAVAAYFMFFAYSSADLNKASGYIVTANFPSVDGLKIGSDVKVNGYKVGSVVGQSLITDMGKDQFLVQVKLTVDPTVKLPMDSIAMIASESLLGGKYMSLEVGVDEETVSTDGKGQLFRTQAPMRLDDLIGQMIYGSKEEKKDKQGDAGQIIPSNQNLASSHP
ncbi:MAG: MCE family protein [Alphaproteobacteria bacterium]|nr:MCE family protein [Alphaproteobacteria bacterium]